MININDFLNSDKIIPDMTASSKQEAIGLLVDKIFSGEPDRSFPIDRDAVLQEVMKRENMQSTGIGNGVAFPHARIEGWGDFAMAMGVCRSALEFESIDSIPVKFVFLMISSQDEPYIILQTMAAIVRFLTEVGGHQPDVLNNPVKMQKILDMFVLAPITVTDNILARDIARPVVDTVHLDTSIEDATRKMHLKQMDVLPVVDAHDRFCGEISCLQVFRYGMPDFFQQLNTISFVKHIDPFERYFRIKRDLTVKDVFEKDSSPLDENSTLLEIIFEMTVKRKNKLYIVDAQRKLTGTIDRFCIIDKILFF
jgi:nitrogen PTS system EIIA component